MKFSKYSGIFLILALLTSMMACEDDTTTIGSSISTGEVLISVDSITFDLGAKAVRIESFDSKTGNLMIGSILTENYGSLSCSFVSRLMCAPTLDVADSLLNPARVDSCKLILGAVRDEITGDSLAPQVFSVYRLNKQLPADINNLFNPEGYYSSGDLLASRSYTLSEIANTDSAFYNNSFVELTVELPKSFGEEIFEKYIQEPEIFAWPQTMAQKYLPGIYVEPTFGKGCIANIRSAYVAVFYYHEKLTTTVTENDTVTKLEHVTNVTFPFSISPEVLSSNNIIYNPSQSVVAKNESNDGEVVITTPGGYIASFDFPAEPLLERYKEQNEHLSTVNELSLYIPAEIFNEESGFTVAQNILLLKSTEYDKFFKENRVPDNLTAFTGVYDSKKKQYYFSSLRAYFLDLLSKDKITKEDVEFTLVPVEIETETTNSYYGSGTTYVTKCEPYTSRPTMTLLKTNEATVTFSFSTQMID